MVFLDNGNNDTFHNRVLLFTFFSIFIICCSSCVTKYEIKGLTKETVMDDGMSIHAKNGSSVIRITADGLKREIIWNGEIIKVMMKARTKRWRGKLGLISDEILDISNDHIVITNVKEAQLHFLSIEKFNKWRKNYFNPERGVYRDDGLFLSWFFSENDQKQIALDISVWQIMIDGEKPTKLPGSDNQNIYSSM